MVNSKKKKEQILKKKIYIGIGIGITIFIGIIIAIIALKAQPKKIELNSKQEVAALSLTVQVAIDRVNGGGEITKQTCEEFRNLAKQYDKNTDWFRTSYCDYIIYADYDDTENTTTVTLSDGTHAAVYTFDHDNDYLLDYKFIESSQKGYGIIIKTSE